MNDANGNHITSNDNETNRQSESPARTIDSHDSTTGSMDTIVDRATHHSNSNNMANTAVAIGGISNGGVASVNSHEEMMQTTIEQSTNTTNINHNSLTNSEIAMLQQQNTSGSDDELMLHQQNKQQLHQQQHQLLQKPMDAQSHIYSSPVYDEKPPQPLKLTAATLVQSINLHEDDLKKPKLISHEEFKQQLEETIASRAATMDSRISKKQRFPPELIKDDGSSTKSSKSLKKKSSMPKSSTDCCSAFPVQIILGLLQLLLSICLVALGSLLIVRDASLSTAGCGIWTGLIAAVTGSLGVVGLRKTQTSFLALSLVCIASSTLALAISGIGLSRDVNRSKENFDLLNSNSEISAASGLIFTLFIHFVVSIISVYRCALQICSSISLADLEGVIRYYQHSQNNKYNAYNNNFVCKLRSYIFTLNTTSYKITLKKCNIIRIRTHRSGGGFFHHWLATNGLSVVDFLEMFWKSNSQNNGVANYTKRKHLSLYGYPLQLFVIALNIVKQRQWEKS